MPIATPMQTLDAQLLDAHTRNDTHALIELYTLAGDWAEGEGRIDAACFYLTHAYVHALELGIDAAPIHDRLKAYRRI